MHFQQYQGLWLAAFQQHTPHLLFLKKSARMICRRFGRMQKEW